MADIPCNCKDVSREEFFKYLTRIEFIASAHCCRPDSYNLHLLRTAWKLLEISSFGDVFIDAEEDFKAALDDLAAYQARLAKRISRLMQVHIDKI